MGGWVGEKTYLPISVIHKQITIRQLAGKELCGWVGGLFRMYFLKCRGGRGTGAGNWMKEETGRWVGLNELDFTGWVGGWVVYLEDVASDHAAHHGKAQRTEQAHELVDGLGGGGAAYSSLW